MTYYEETSLQKFTESYQYLYNDMAGWEQYNDREFLVTLNDGSTYLFDGVRQLARHVRLVDNSSNLTNEEWLKGFSDLLKERLRRKHIRQYELAKLIGVTPRTVNRYIACESMPPLQIVQRIAEAVGCSVDDLCPKGFVYLD